MVSDSKKRAKRPFPHEVDPSELEQEYPKKRKRSRRSRNKAQSVLDNIVRTDTNVEVLLYQSVSRIDSNPNQLDLFDPLNSPNYG